MKKVRGTAHFHVEADPRELPVDHAGRLLAMHMTGARPISQSYLVMVGRSNTRTAGRKAQSCFEDGHSANKTQCASPRREEEVPMASSAVLPTRKSPTN